MTTSPQKLIGTHHHNADAIEGLEHDLLDGTINQDTEVATVVTGDLIFGNLVPLWGRLPFTTAPSAGLRNALVGDDGDAVPAWRATLDTTAPTDITPGDVADSGSALIYARRDHLHGAGAISSAPHNLLSLEHPDTTPASPTRGDTITAQGGSPTWSVLSLGAADTFFGSDGTDPGWRTPGALTRVDDTNVTLTLGGTPGTALLRAASLTLGWTGLLAIGRGGTGVSALGDITRVNDTNVTLTLGGTPLGALITSTSFTLGWTGSLSIARGGTGQNTKVDAFNALSPLSTLGDMLFFNSGGDNARLGVGSAGNYLGVAAGIPSWKASAALTKTDDTNVTLTLGGAPASALLVAASLTLGWTGLLGLARGGTHADLSATGGAGRYLKQASAGADITVGTIPASDIASGAALTKVDDTNVTLALGGTPASALLAAASLTLGWTGTLSVARGGIGVGTLASNGVLYGQGTSAVLALAVNATATNKFLTQSSSAAPAWATLVAGDLPANGANPTASIGLAAVNGSATTWMRSDGAPALSVAIAPTWTAEHTFSQAGTADPATGSMLGITLRSTDITSAAKTGILFAAFDGGSVQRHFAGIMGAKTNDWSSTISGYLSFWTRTAGGNEAEAMRILDTGGATFFSTVTPQIWIDNTASGNAILRLSAKAGSVSEISFRDGTVGKWQLLKNTDNSLAINDFDTPTANAFRIVQGAVPGVSTVGYVRIGSATVPGGVTAGDLTFVRAFINNDANFNLSFSGSNPVIGFDSGDSLIFTRSANQWDFLVGTTSVLTLFGGTGAQMNLQQAAGSSAVWIQALNTTTGLGAHSDAIYVMKSSNFTNADWAFFTGASHIDGVGDHWILYNRITGNNFHVLPNGSATLSAGPLTIGAIAYPGSVTTHTLGVYSGLSLSIGGGLFIPLYA